MAAPGRRRLAVAVAVPVAAVLALFVGVLATREPAVNRKTDSPLLDQPAPGIRGETLDGQRFDLGDLEGRWVLVNFFASWCVPCIQEHPELKRFSAEHAAAGDAEVVSVVYDNDQENTERFFAREGGDWPVVTDPQGRVALDYGVARVPESFLVDPDGVVRVKITGGVEQAGLDELLAEAGG